MSFYGPMDGTRHWTLGAGGAAAARPAGRKSFWRRLPRAHGLVRVLLLWLGG